MNTNKITISITCKLNIFSRSKKNSKKSIKKTLFTISGNKRKKSSIFTSIIISIFNIIIIIFIIYFIYYIFT